MNKIRISVIIPTFNRANYLKKCLSALFEDIRHGKHNDVEVIVIDDGSTENVKEQAIKFPVRFYRLKKNSGPAAARNLGIRKAKGNIVFFIDSDVLLQNNGLSYIKKNFKKDRNIAAVQGNYTKYPYFTNFFTKYKNVLLHYSFLKYNKKYGKGIATFCAAVKKNIIKSIGGFNEDLKTASIEDEEPGLMIYSKGKKILFDSSIQVKHMKKHNFLNLFKQDFDTSFLKIKSILHDKILNINRLEESHLGMKYLSTIPLSNLILINIILLFFLNTFWIKISFFILIALYLLLNLDMYFYFWTNNGTIFTINSFLFSFINNLIIIIAILFGFIDFLIKRNNTAKS